MAAADFVPTIVYRARTLEDVQKVEAGHEPRGLRYVLARVCIVAWLVLANAALAVLMKLLFGFRVGCRSDVRHVVAYTTGTLGDNVVVLPALGALRQAFPGSSLAVVTNATGYDPQLAGALFAMVPWIDRLVVLPDDPVKREGLRLSWSQAALAAGPCDLFVNLSRFGNTGWLGAVVREMLFAGRLGARRAVGFRLNSYNRRGDILNKVKHRFVRNEPRRASLVIEELGLRPCQDLSLLAPDPDTRNAISRMLAPLAGRAMFIMNPGAKFKIKRWPLDRFGQVAAQLVAQYDAAIVFTGTADEEPLAAALCSYVRDRSLNVAGRTSVQGLVELLHRSTACVTNDTGTMHLAAALDVPTVAMFTTRLSPSHWFPVGNRVISLFSFSEESYTYNDEGDAPCKCLTHIGVLDVMGALQEVMAMPARGQQGNVLDRGSSSLQTRPESESLDTGRGR